MVWRSGFGLNARLKPAYELRARGCEEALWRAQSPDSPNRPFTVHCRSAILELKVVTALLFGSDLDSTWAHREAKLGFNSDQTCIKLGLNWVRLRFHADQTRVQLAD